MLGESLRVYRTHQQMSRYKFKLGQMAQSKCMRLGNVRDTVDIIVIVAKEIGLKNWRKKMSCEPVITIWGKELTLGQCMTIRVALQSFALDLHARGLGDDETGVKITDSYLKNIGEINEIIFGGNYGN